MEPELGKISPAEAVETIATWLDKRTPARTAEEWQPLHSRLEKQLERDQAWSRQFDAKIGPIIATDGVLIGLAAKLLADEYDFLQSHVLLRVGIYGVIMLWGLSAVYSILAISPKLTWRDLAFWERMFHLLPHDNNHATQIFFSHIACYDSAVAYAGDAAVSMESGANYAAQLFQQVYNNARVAQDKARQVRWAVVWLLLGAALSALVAIIVTIIGGWGR